MPRCHEIDTRDGRRRVLRGEHAGCGEQRLRFAFCYEKGDLHLPSPPGMSRAPVATAQDLTGIAPTRMVDLNTSIRKSCCDGKSMSASDRGDAAYGAGVRSFTASVPALVKIN
jgi:hypothetical protein